MYQYFIPFCLLNNILLYGYITFYLVLNQLIGIWIVYFVALMNNAVLPFGHLDSLFPKWLHNFIVPPAMYKGSNFCPHKHLQLPPFLITVILVDVNSISWWF